MVAEASCLQGLLKECCTGLCGRTGLTSGADEFVFFCDLEAQDVVLPYLAVTMGNNLSLPAQHHMSGI